jgi:hypothetical protein
MYKPHSAIRAIFLIALLFTYAVHAEELTAEDAFDALHKQSKVEISIYGKGMAEVYRGIGVGSKPGPSTEHNARMEQIGDHYRIK